MVNLKELVFGNTVHRGPHTAIFPARYKPHLEKFTWSVRGGNPYQDPDGPRDESYVSQTLKFLEGQTQLRVLHWQPSPRIEPHPKPCPDSFFPKLDTLIGDIETIRTFLPGRCSVTTLQWITGIGTRYPLIDTFEQVFNKVSPQLKGIKHLSIQPLADWQYSGHLQPIIPHLYSIETLHIFSVSEHEIVGDFYEELPFHTL